MVYDAVEFPEPPQREFDGRKRSLHIGINYMTSKEYRLDGCGNDCRKHAELMRDFLDFDEVRILVDDQPTAWGLPTRENIIENIMWLFSDAHPHDVLVFTYSGHGVQVVDQTGMEADGYDEAIVPCDYLDHNRVILDNELLAFADLRPHGTVTTLVFDCCHSGTMLDLAHCIDNSKWLIFEEKNIADRTKRTRDASGWIVGTAPVVGGKPRAMPALDDYAREKSHVIRQKTHELHRQRSDHLKNRVDLAASDGGTWCATPDSWEGHAIIEGKQFAENVREERDIFVLSACRDDQTALDMSLRGASGGVLTYCLMKAFQKNGFLVDYKALFHCISDEARELRSSHLPQLDQRFMISFGDTKPRRQLFLGGEVPEEMPRPIPGFSGKTPRTARGHNDHSEGGGWVGGTQERGGSCECSIM